jgi:NAD(P)-dependent dehydrogenase (short-subunit alcohol dehydrogenase family)
MDALVLSLREAREASLLFRDTAVPRSERQHCLKAATNTAWLLSGIADNCRHGRSATCAKPESTSRWPGSWLTQRGKADRHTNNVAYGSAKADQAHQVRLLAAELGEHGIPVNSVNPDGVVRGSGIFAGGWGTQRAAVYGVPAEELGAFYAQRTLLKREVLPEHVDNAVFVLTSGELSHTTGLHIPVDAGVAAAFLR